MPAKTDSNFRAEPEIEEIVGIDLKIDDSVTRICEVSNSSSSNTRNIWYIIVIVSTLSFAEFWNTHPKNLSSERVDYYKKEFLTLMPEIAADSALKGRSLDTSKINFELQTAKNMLDIFTRLDIQNGNIQIPILGNYFDIADLGLFAGFAFVVLLLILKFILLRKVMNLKKALTAISARYSDDAEAALFAGYHGVDPLAKTTLYSINLYRRRYHYDILCMNEIFTVAPEKIPVVWFSDRTIEWCRKKVFFIPLVVFVLIVSNDIAGIWLYGWGIYKANHIFLLVINALYLYLVYAFAVRCTAKSVEIESLYADFKRNRFKYPWP
jgi:hypothetical protein